MERQMIPGWPAALTVAGSDSWGGAGIEADLRTFSAVGVWGSAAVTAVTAQNHRGVLSAALIEPSMVAAQIDAVAETGAVRAVKTGMLGSVPIIDAVASALSRHHFGPLVVDPVQAAARGGRLLDAEALPVLVERLFPRAALVTPNLPEAEALVGHVIDSRTAMEEAAAVLGAMGPAAVLLKGGHLEGDESPDLLWSGGRARWLEGERVTAIFSHGTGCTLSAAIAALLARGADLDAACRGAKQYVHSCLLAVAEKP